VRGERAARAPGAKCAEDKPAKKRRGSASWARLISKVFHADPLKCPKCGGKLQAIAYITDQMNIRKVLDHLGLSPPENERPPPDIRYVPVDHEGRQLEGVAEKLAAPWPGLTLAGVLRFVLFAALAAGFLRLDFFGGVLRFMAFLIFVLFTVRFRVGFGGGASGSTGTRPPRLPSWTSSCSRTPRMMPFAPS
jgi:hypothetical protein